MSDSGTLSEVVNIELSSFKSQEMHERPEGMEEASVMMVGLSAERVMQGLRILGQARELKEICVGGLFRSQRQP